MHLKGGSVVGEGLAVTDENRWWYSVAGSQKNKWCVLFLEQHGEGTPSSSFVALPPGGPHWWFPLAGPDPRGLYVVGADDGTHVHEITREGIRRTWTIDRHPDVNGRFWSAQTMPDGSAALNSLESTDGEMPAAVSLHIFHGDDLDTIPLQSGRRYLRAASATRRTRIAGRGRRNLLRYDRSDCDRSGKREQRALVGADGQR